jgi:hypothetical protein
MNEELVTPTIEEEAPKKEYDLVKIQAAYDLLKASDKTQISRTEYAKYQWLEEKLCEAGIIGELAWEAEFAKEEVKEEELLPKDVPQG